MREAGEAQDTPLVVIVVDDHAMGGFIRQALGEDCRVEVLDRTRVADVFSLSPDVVVSDVETIANVGHLRGEHPSALVVIATDASHAARTALFEHGADDYLLLPLSTDEVRARVGVRARTAKQVERFKRAERECHRLEAQLEAANAELHRFTYAVSHDLRAPVRAIEGFSAALLSENAAALAPDVRSDLEHVRAGAQRLSSLIDGLAALSRVGRAPIARTRLDLAVIARAVVADLRSRFPTRTVDVTIANDLWAEADPRLACVVLEQLIGNAWKFTSKWDGASIAVGAERQADEEVFFVRDDGVGFDPRYGSRLFAPLQRLHGAEFDGIGIGLATVQRIVRRHGGRVWAEAVRDNGAVFRFTLSEARTPTTPR